LNLPEEAGDLVQSDRSPASVWLSCSPLNLPEEAGDLGGGEGIFKRKVL
jgi:hypothetical protein